MKDLIAAVAVTLAIQAALSLLSVAPAVLAPVAAQDVGVPATAIGIFTALIYLSAAVAAPLGGSFVAHRGALRVSQCCLTFACAGFALCALSHPLALIAGALLLGCGYGPMTPASSVILAARTPERMRNLIMSIRQTGVPLGGAIAGLLMPALLLYTNWKAATLAVAALCFAFVLALETLRSRYDGANRPPASAARPGLRRMMRMVMSHPRMRESAFATFVYGGMQWCLASYLVVFLMERAGASLINAGLALSAAMTAGVAGRIFWGYVADRVGSARKVLGALGIAMSLCAFVLSQAGADWPFWAIVVLSAIYGGTAIGWNGVYVAEIARIAPGGQIATATGASLTFTYLGVVVMPIMFWLVVTLSGSYAIAYIAAGFITLVPGISYLLRRD